MIEYDGTCVHCCNDDANEVGEEHIEMMMALIKAPTITIK